MDAADDDLIEMASKTPSNTITWTLLPIGRCDIIIILALVLVLFGLCSHKRD